jgi:hypothetical protein
VPLIVGGRTPRPPEGICPVDAAGIFTTYACLPHPPEGMTCEDAYNESCVLSTYACGGSIYGTSILCGPVADGAANCCYLTTGPCRPD